MPTDRGAAGFPVARPGLLPVFKGVVALFTALVLVQAVLAGRGWFVDFSLIELHGNVGNAVFLVAVVQVALAFGLGARGLILPLGVVILLLVIAQTGLGYAGRDSAAAAAWHIPNGVLIFGLLTAYSTMVFRLGR